MSPGGHAQIGVAISGTVYATLMPVLGPLGLGILVPAISAILGFIFHPPTDQLYHADTVLCGTEEEYEQSMKWDPKVLIHKIGLWPIFTKNGREKLAEINHDLAHPKPVEIARTPMNYAYADCVLGMIIMFGWAWLYRDNFWACVTVLAGGFFSMAPDFILAKFIHSKHIDKDGFWRWDYFHHWCHCPVMVYKDRILAFCLTAIQFIVTGILAWYLRPHP